MPTECAPPGEMAMPQPVFLAANGRASFAWHHLPPAYGVGAAAIVLCPPLGSEYVSTYRTLRILAERLADRGCHVLRLDYDGAGNSVGEYTDPDRVDAWVGSIAAAIVEARRLSGGGAVALVGVRAGAMLALQAAAAGSVDRLVLWSAAPSGRLYVREIQAFAAVSRQAHAAEDGANAPINDAGHLMTRQTAAALARWTVDEVTGAPAPEVLVVDRDDRPLDPSLAARLVALGSEVTSICPAGTGEMLTAPQLAKVPEPAVDAITTWFGSWHASAPACGIGAPTGASVPGAAFPVVHGCNYVEQPVRFGPEDRLFGVLTSPSDVTSKSPAIVLFNTGVEHHIGPHRLYVPLARELAALGHVVLRFDLGGIGDSVPPDAMPENVAYPPHALDDARAAIAFIRKHAPDRRVIAAGLCSGGWLAFRAAREGLPVDAIVAVNPPLYLMDGVDGRQWLAERDELKRYQHSLHDMAKWAKALRGGASYATFMRMAANAVGRRLAARFNGVFGDAGGLAKDLTAIAARGVKALFVFSHGDDGLEYFRLHASAALKRGAIQDCVQHVVVDGAGHSFRPCDAQRRLSELLTGFVASQTSRTPSRASTAASISTGGEDRRGRGPAGASASVSSNLILGTVSRYVLLAANIGTGVFLMPFTVTHLGKTQYGLWMLVASMAYYFQLLDLGYGNGVVRHIVAADRRGCPDDVNRIVSTFVCVYGVIGMAACALVAMVTIFVVPTFPHLSPTEVRLAQVLLVLIGMRVAIGFPMTVFGAVTNARQGFALNNSVALAAVLANAAATYLILSSGRGLVFLVATTTAINIASYAGYARIARAVFPQLQIRLRYFSRADWRAVTSFSLYLFVIQIAAQITFNMDSIVIGAYVSTAAVAVYAVSLRLTEYQRRLCDQFSGMLFPVVVGYVAQGDGSALRRALVDGTRVGVALVAGAAICLIGFGRPLIIHWMGPSFGDSVAPFVVLSVGIVVIVSHAAVENVLIAGNAHRAVAAVWVTEALANALLSVWLVHPLALVGVALGTTVPLIVGHVLVLMPLACRRADIRVSRFIAETVRPVLPGCVGAIALRVWLIGRWPPTSMWGVSAEAVLVGTVYLLAVALLGFDQSVRRRYSAQAVAAWSTSRRLLARGAVVPTQ